MMKTIKTVIFDMDGVIFDSEKVYYDAFYVAADEHEIDVNDDMVLEFSGKTTETVLLMLQNFLNNDIEKTQRFVQSWGKARWDILASQGLPFKAGFLPLFDAIKASGRDIGLVTSANYDDINENFERNNSDLLKQFTHIITIDDVRFPKPNPQPYQIMMRHLGHDPQECMVVEDSITGVSAATAAGAHTIMINAHISPPPELDEKLLMRVSHHDEILGYLQDNGL